VIDLGLKDKRFIVFGVSNEKSIAWAIVKRLHEAGAEIALSYAGENLERRVVPLAESLGIDMVYRCDVQSDEELEATFKIINKKWDKFDGYVHSVAYATREDMQGRFSDTSRAGFHTAMDISVYSMIALMKYSRPFLNNDSSALTLTYLGSQRVVDNYKVMGVAKAALEATVRYLSADVGPEEGIRVNAISAGPIRTLAASGIPGFKDMLGQFEEKAPLRRKVDADEVAKAAIFLLSELSSGITGEITWVDCGFNIIGV
jgi:enoyl-[acyl-carrier protein] reductase I